MGSVMTPVLLILGAVCVGYGTYAYIHEAMGSDPGIGWFWLAMISIGLIIFVCGLIRAFHD